MNEKRYEVIDEYGHSIAKGMSLDMAIMFIKAYIELYYEDSVMLTIKEELHIMSAQEIVEREA